jgi:hypothetical protein
MADGYSLIGIFAFSAIKFFLAPAASTLLGFGFLKTVLITSTGGGASFLLFYKFGNLIKKKYQTLFKRKAKPKFNKKNKMIVRIKSKYGFWGLAFLTPCLFGIPLGSLLAATYYSKDRRTIPFFLLSIMGWSMLLTMISLKFTTI